MQWVIRITQYRKRTRILRYVWRVEEKRWWWWWSILGLEWLISFICFKNMRKIFIIIIIIIKWTRRKKNIYKMFSYNKGKYFPILIKSKDLSTNRNANRISIFFSSSSSSLFNLDYSWFNICLLQCYINYWEGKFALLAPRNKINRRKILFFLLVVHFLVHTHVLNNICDIYIYIEKKIKKKFFLC